MCKEVGLIKEEDVNKYSVKKPSLAEQLRDCKEQLSSARKCITTMEQDNTVLKRLFAETYANLERESSVAEDFSKRYNDIHNDLRAIRNMLFYGEPKVRLSKCVKDEILDILNKNNI